MLLFKRVAVFFSIFLVLSNSLLVGIGDPSLAAGPSVITDIKSTSGNIEVVSANSVLDNGKIKVTATIKNNASISQNAGVVVVGKDANGKAIETREVHEMHSTWGYPIELASNTEKTFDVYLEKGSKITSVEVLPSGNSQELIMLSSGYYKENGKVIITGVVENGSNQDRVVGMITEGIDVAGKVVEVKSDFSKDKTFGNAEVVEAKSAYTFEIVLDSASLIDNVRVNVTGKGTDVKVLSYGVRTENAQVIVTGVVENGTTSEKVLELQGITYDAEGNQIESVTKRSVDPTFGKDEPISPGATYAFTLSFNEQNVRKVKVDLPSEIDGFNHVVTLDDVTAPFVLTEFPKKDAKNVDVKQQLKLTFNEEIKVGSTFQNIILKDSTGNQIELTKEIKEKELVIAPIYPLSSETNYVLTIPLGAVQDVTGNMSKEHQQSFSTARLGEDVENYHIIHQSETWNENKTINNPLIVGPNATLTIASGVSVSLNQDLVVYGKIENYGTITQVSGKTKYANHVKLSWATMSGDKNYLSEGVIDPGGTITGGSWDVYSPDFYPIPPMTIDRIVTGTAPIIEGRTVAGSMFS